MKNIALLSLIILCSSTFTAVSAEDSQNSPLPAVQKEQAVTEEKKQDSEIKKETAENAENTSKKESFLSPEDKTKQEIADNNYSLSFFVQRMELDLDQLDKAKKFSDEDKLKRESLLRSIYMLRDQSRDLEQQSYEKFKGILKPEQLAVFEELRKEQLNYRNKYDVLAGSVEQLVDNEKKNIAAHDEFFAKEQKKEADQKKFETEAKKSRLNDLKHGRWDKKK